MGIAAEVGFGSGSGRGAENSEATDESRKDNDLVRLGTQ
jgi:hypothetical protein